MPPPAATTTRSTCTTETAQGTHVFDIFNYSLHKGMGIDKFLRSAAFSVGGYRWAIRFYPDCPRVPAGADGPAWQPVFVYLVLLSKGATVRASCDLGLIHPATGLSVTVHTTAEPRVFKYGEASMYYPRTAFLDRAELEASPYLVDDWLSIHCVVTVIKKPRVFEARTGPICVLGDRITNPHLKSLLTRHGDYFGPKRVRPPAAAQASSTTSPGSSAAAKPSLASSCAPRLL
ncbi:unnamed protein product [Urochloa humidicola]